ncbi:MAG: hypothetical protein Q8N51_17470 [Gammaproteobacteria bacterium]|nr:hypothetical protein [Gammaproteobacteria bacterium]
MDITAVSTLVNTIGIGGVFLYASWYLMRRLEAREASQRQDALEREKKLLEALTENQHYTRTTVVSALERNTDATRATAVALEGLACRGLRTDELRPLIERAQRRAGEG